MEYRSDSKDSDMTVLTGDDTYKPEEDEQPVPLTQAKLKDLTGDLNLSKESAKLLGSCFKEKHVGTRRENKDNFSSSRISHHRFIVTTLLN